MPKVFRQQKTPKGGWCNPPWIFAFPSEFFENISHGYVFGVKESNGDNEKILSSLHDLENQGQTPFCMTFLISGCKHDTKLILVSILTFSRSGILNMWKKNHVTLTVDLGTQGHTHSLYDLSYLRLNTSYRLDLGVDSNICKVEDLRKPKIFHLTLMFDLENLGQTLFCMTFHISGCKHHTKSILVSILTFSEIEDIKNVENKHVTLTVDLETQGHTLFSYDLAYLRLYACYWLDLGVESNIFKVEDLRKFIFGYLTLMFDLDFQGQTTFLWIYIIFKVNHHRYIIYSWFIEFIHLDYVKFNNKINSVTCIQQEIMKVI